MAFDGIPGEVIKTPRVIRFLHKLLSVCFEKSRIPKLWAQGIVNPIPKSSTSDPRDPLSYRGITLAPVVYKVYCTVLNARITSWAEEENVLVDQQNGFRKGRSTIDHLSTLNNIIETRKRQRKSTFCAFIDFKKAYDIVDRTILWDKLTMNGIGGKLHQAVKSLYENIQCCVRVNGFHTDWFDVRCGLKQGCPLSPTLFNIFINDLAVEMHSLGKGVRIGDELLSVLLYADDIVLLAETPEDLQSLLDTLHGWCRLNGMTVNPQKSNVIHFRPKCIPRCPFIFMCGDSVITTTGQYKYLGLIINEYMDYSITAKFVSQSANRALGLVIAKVKSFGGVPYNVYTKLYDSVVCPVITYGAAIWGTESFSCINAVQQRAARFFLNVGRYTPNAAVSGDIGWTPMICRLSKAVSNYWCRATNMENDRVNKRVLVWADTTSGNACKNWPFRVKQQFLMYNLEEFCNINVPLNKRYVSTVFLQFLMTECIDKWRDDVNRDTSKSGNGGNKLRTYKCFKSTFDVEFYCKRVLSAKHRGALAKFRSGTAPIRLETGRYEKLQVCDRTCFNCTSIVEDELHVLIHCPLYDDLRFNLFNEATSVCLNFQTLNDEEKLHFILSYPDIVNFSAKTCWNILERRRSLLRV